MNQINRLWHRFLVIIGLLGAILIVGTIGFVFIDGFTPFDAFYLTLVTITTIGYSEIGTLSQAGRIFNVFIIITGVLTLLLAIGTLTQTILELELANFFEKRRAKRMIQKLSNHYILCGYGRMGRGAAAELASAKAAFIVIDKSEQKVELAMHAGMLAVQADCTRDEILREAGIDRARGLISTLGTDADNLFLVLSAKSLNPKLMIATRVSEEEAEAKMHRAGADVIYAPFSTAGSRMSQSLLRPHVHEFLDFTTNKMGIDVRIEQILVSPESEFVYKSIGQAQIRKDMGVIVLAIRQNSGEMLFNPPPEASIVAGAHLIVMGPTEKLRQLEKLLTERTG